MSIRKYNQSCSLAIALDIIGERWTWLILRALLTGPKRYGEIQQQLPGIGTNLLAERLKALCENGIARKSGTGRQSAYELTESGEALRPITHQLIRWGRQFWTSQGSAGENPAISMPEWDMLAMEAAFLPEKAAGIQAVLQITLSGFSFHLLIKNQQCRAVSGLAIAPDVSITSDSATLLAIGRQETSVASEEEKVRLKIEGDREMFKLLFDLFDSV
jgi:DNA-binding HxlR family transcriptional regulator